MTVTDQRPVPLSSLSESPGRGGSDRQADMAARGPRASLQSGASDQRQAPVDRSAGANRHSLGSTLAGRLGGRAVGNV
jgi:hypothetical protein